MPSGRPQSFRYQDRPVDDRSPEDEGEWHRTAKEGAEFFMTRWFATERARAALRHAVVSPNVTGRTKERVAQSKRASNGLLVTID